MFGHQNNDNNNFSQDNGVQHGSDTPVGSIGMPMGMASGGLEPETVAPTTSSAPVVDDASIGSYVVSDTDKSQSTSLVPASTPLPSPSSPPVIPHSDYSGAPHTTMPSSTAAAAQVSKSPATASQAGDLMALKQSALHELSPLLGHLEQTPEEKFRTTMMMIQASDDHTMLQAAYDAARSIHDEKARAQALLDVVNEINYFTQATTDTMAPAAAK